MAAPVLAALLVAGCSSNEPGNPVAGETTTTTTTTTTKTSTTTTTSETSSARPKPIDMAAVDVCQLIGAISFADFAPDGNPIGGESTLFPGSQDCYVNSLPQNRGLILVAVRDQGTTEYLDGANAEITETQAAGYPLYVLTLPDPASCFGALDVNDGQMLFINYGMNQADTAPMTPREQLCAAVPEIATAALAQLGA